MTDSGMPEREAKALENNGKTCKSVSRRFCVAPMMDGAPRSTIL
jgi:hypothetical protein